MTSQRLSVAVVVPTYRRPDHVRICLEHIATQTIQPIQTVVVDASPNDATYLVIADEFPNVDYVRNPLGAGHLGASLDLGLRAVSADIVVFIDDDAFSERNCIEALLAQYRDPTVGGVGGRIRNDIQGEESAGVDRIGMFTVDGGLTGYFGADPGKPVRVDHLIGACMSWRREILIDNGGIRDDYRGGGSRSDADIAFRTARAGWQIVYQPSAVVRHVSGPRYVGRRFGLRYTYYGNRNHLVLLLQNLGPRDPRVRRHFRVIAAGVRGRVRDAVRPAAAGDTHQPLSRRLAGALAHSAATVLGLVVGTAAGLRKWRSSRLA